MSKKIQIAISKELDAKIGEIAKKRYVKKNDLMRQALANIVIDDKLLQSNN